MFEGAAWTCVGPRGVVGQEVGPRYDQPTNLHQIQHDQEVVNTDPASDQHQEQANTVNPHQGLVSPLPH